MKALLEHGKKQQESCRGLRVRVGRQGDTIAVEEGREVFAKPKPSKKQEAVRRSMQVMATRLNQHPTCRLPDLQEARLVSQV